jgi:hypothetical protein
VSAEIASLSLANIGDTFAVREILFPLVSEGTGRARGIELSFEQRASEARPWYAQINAALSRAEHAGRDRVRRAGSFDYPLVLNLLGGYRVSSRWEVSVRTAYLTGRPYTPFDTLRSVQQRRGVYDLTRVNDSRTSDYFRTDVRVDWTFRVNAQPVTMFAGVQNVTNRTNVAGLTWDRRYNQPRVSEQQGVFPVLGLDWRF